MKNKKKTKTIEVAPGARIDLMCEQLVREAPAMMVFNGTPVTSQPGDTTQMVYDRWSERRERDQKAKEAATKKPPEQLQAEVDMLRGVDCEADGDGPCGACLKCAIAGQRIVMAAQAKDLEYRSTTSATVEHVLSESKRRADEAKLRGDPLPTVDEAMTVLDTMGESMRATSDAPPPDFLKLARDWGVAEEDRVSLAAKLREVYAMGRSTDDAPPFKVGDRIRCLYSGGFEAIVTGVSQRITFRTDDGRDSMWCDTDRFELAQKRSAPVPNEATLIAELTAQRDRFRRIVGDVCAFVNTTGPAAREALDEEPVRSMAYAPIAGARAQFIAFESISGNAVFAADTYADVEKLIARDKEKNTDAEHGYPWTYAITGPWRRVEPAQKNDEAPGTSGRIMELESRLAERTDAVRILTERLKEQGTNYDEAWRTKLSLERLAVLATTAGGHSVGAPATREEEQAMAKEILRLRVTLIRPAVFDAIWAVIGKHQLALKLGDVQATPIVRDLVISVCTALAIPLTNEEKYNKENKT